MVTWLSRYKRLLLVLGFLGILLGAAHLSGVRDTFDLHDLQRRILENKTEGLLIFVLLFSLGNLIQIPGWIFLAAAVLALGQIAGGLATYVAACISCLVTFLVIRGMGGDALRQLDHPLALGLLKRLDDRPIFSVMMLRTLFQTAPALNYTLAMSGITLRAYLIGTVLGLPAPILVYCLFFDTLGKALNIAGWLIATASSV